MTEQPKPQTDTGTDPRPIDVAQVDEDSDWALQIRFNVPDRPEIDDRLLRLTGALNLLVREGLAENNPEARALYRAAYVLLGHQGVERTDAQAYEHVRALARVARTFAALYRRR
ncbi:hypothetical protein G6045_19105 [Streptomyces sp. YC504]|uniref:Uncharacterized protein n=1 Tax=Streptomyces mesophilus TaxID=1775132 RepID=A0A6G4XKQ0_9ACTN|nr:DUF6415 family natural product biosynthesis protein [Streptomyces mesophilus]NGO77752.1 hypothetical protein [Streptomyces mesophilus]